MATRRTERLVNPVFTAVQELPPSILLNTPLSVAAYTVAGDDGSIAIPPRETPPPGPWLVHVFTPARAAVRSTSTSTAMETETISSTRRVARELDDRASAYRDIGNLLMSALIAQDAFANRRARDRLRDVEVTIPLDYERSGADQLRGPWSRGRPRTARRFRLARP